jgi:hypothetical protein
MKKLSIILASIFLILLLASCCGSKYATGSLDSKAVNIDSAFKKVYRATQEALIESKSKLKLKSIDLAFTTTTTIDANGGVKLWIITGKYSVSKANSKKTIYTFGESEHLEKALTPDPNIKEFKEYLIASIQQSQNITNIDNFGLKEMEVEVEFTMKKTIEGSVEIELLPVTPSAGVSHEKEAVHTITLKFEN